MANTAETGMRQREGQQTGVVMFVMNDLLNDPRVQREARSAVRAGLRVTVVAMQSDRCRVRREIVDGYEIVRVRSHRSVVRFLVVRPLLLGFLMVLVLTEGFKLALGLPPGPEAPGQASGHAGRLRRIKWALMRGVGVLLLPLRVLRPLLSRPGQKLRAGAPPEGSRPGRLTRVRRYISEVGFVYDTFRLILAMLWAVRSVRAAVFHGNDLPTLPLTAWAARLHGGKALYDSHELWVGMVPEMTSLLNSVARWVEHRYIRQMDAVVTVNDLIAEELRRQYRIPLPSVVMNCPEPVVPCAVDPSCSIRAKLGLSPETPIILYQGRYELGRGLEELIESGRYLSKGVIVLRGYGSNEADLRQRVSGLGAPGRVFMVEPVPMADLVNAAAEADVGVVPYTAYSPGYYYASPNKLFEYMFAGLAIAVSNLPFLEKIVRDHDLGVVFDPADPRHIAEQLNALVGNPARLRACRENATWVARNRYNWDHEGGKLIRLYRTLAAGNAHAGTTHAS
jgi:glycosyltransferase involved in cell wall biosynthesis